MASSAVVIAAEVADAGTGGRVPGHHADRHLAAAHGFVAGRDPERKSAVAAGIEGHGLGERVDQDAVPVAAVNSDLDAGEMPRVGAVRDAALRRLAEDRRLIECAVTDPGSVAAPDLRQLMSPSSKSSMTARPTPPGTSAGPRNGMLGSPRAPGSSPATDAGRQRGAATTNAREGTRHAGRSASRVRPARARGDHAGGRPGGRTGTPHDRGDRPVRSRARSRAPSPTSRSAESSARRRRAPGPTATSRRRSRTPRSRLPARPSMSPPHAARRDQPRQLRQRHQQPDLENAASPDIASAQRSRARAQKR